MHTKPSYDFPVRKRRRNQSGSLITSSGSASEIGNDHKQEAEQCDDHRDATAVPAATIKAAITRICTSKDDILDRFDILLGEFQKAVQVKQAQTDLLRHYLRCSGEGAQPAKRLRFAGLSTVDIGSRYENVQAMLDAALADTHTPSSGQRDRKACSEALCTLCGNSVQALWTFFCSQGRETLEQALVLRAGYSIPEAQAVVSYFEDLAAVHSDKSSTPLEGQESVQLQEDSEPTAVAQAINDGSMDNLSLVK